MIFLRFWLRGDSGLHKNRSFYHFFEIVRNGTDTVRFCNIWTCIFTRTYGIILAIFCYFIRVASILEDRIFEVFRFSICIFLFALLLVTFDAMLLLVWGFQKVEVISYIASRILDNLCLTCLLILGIFCFNCSVLHSVLLVFD